jgi:hypothetical protein
MHVSPVRVQAKGSELETTLAILKLEGSSAEVLRQCIAATGVVRAPANRNEELLMFVSK